MDKRNIEAIFPLLPLQQAFFFRHQLDAAAGALTATARLLGPLDPHRLQDAWDRTLRRHELLRASVHERDQKPPMLVTWKQVSQVIEVVDLRERSAAKQQTAIVEFRERLESETLNLGQAPVGSLTLFQIADNEHQLLWRLHHLFLDGWSTALVLRDLVKLYAAFDPTTRTTLPPQPRYADYLNWHNGLSRDDALAFWQEKLAGYQGVPRFPNQAAGNPSLTSAAAITSELSESASAALNQLSRQGITSSAVANAAWALSLGELYQTDDVLTGIVTSGRAADIPSIESLTGLLSNVVPFRVRLPNHTPTADWLRETRDQQFAQTDAEATPWDEVQRASEIRPGASLSEALLVVENFAVEDSSTALQLAGFESELISDFPLTLSVIPGAKWVLKLQCGSHALSAEAAKRLLHRIEACLQAIPSALELPVLELASRLPQLEPLQLSHHVATHVTQPRTDVEERLAHIWKTVLGIFPGVQANFFEHGGRSLTALELVNLIEQEFGVSFSPAVLIEHPTIEALADAISDADMASDVLIKFDDADRDTVIACVHVGGEYGIYFRFLAKHLQEEYSVVGLQSRGLQSGHFDRSIDAIVSTYVDELLKAYPHKRFVLVGYCMGGTVATEMSRRLQSLGHPVDHLIMVDTGPIWVDRDARQLPHFQKHFGRIAGPFVYWMYLAGFREIKRYYEDLKHLLRNSSSSRREYRRRRVERASRRAFFGFKANPFSVPLYHFSSSEYRNTGRTAGQLESWRPLATLGMQTETIEGAHESILLEPTVRKVAEAILKIGRSKQDELAGSAKTPG